MATTYDTRGWDAPTIYKDKAVRNTVIQVYDRGCNLTGWRITNPNSSTVYVKFFNAAATSSTTLGTTEPCKEFSVPALGEIFVSHHRSVSQFYFSNGLQIVAVSALATSSTSALVLDIDVEIYYQKEHPQS